jgi:hypothetical protein
MVEAGAPREWPCWTKPWNFAANGNCTPRAAVLTFAVTATVSVVSDCLVVYSPPAYNPLNLRHAEFCR